MLSKNHILLVFILLIYSCGGESEVQTKDPSNLSLEVSIAEGNTGVVDIMVNADNAIEFQIDLGLNNGAIITNTTGLYTHTYEITGVYLISVKAIGTSKNFLSKTKEITVQVGEIGGPVTSDDGYITPLSYTGMNLVWQDEFNGTSLNELDWNYETGTGSSGWGNNELQNYRTANTTVSNGRLVIEARKENVNSSAYTSSRLTTQNKFDFKYGRVDIRAVMPQGKGLWPALWMLGTNITTTGWPSCGEIDIMEMIGGGSNDSKTHGTVHWSDGSNQYASFGASKALGSGKLSDEFHVYTIIWDASSITWYLDDVQFNTISTSPAHLDEFRNNFFFIFNVAVGGNWPGSPDGNTVFPQQMTVDYVRVFQTQ
jgi:hypothetical protein